MKLWQKSKKGWLSCSESSTNCSVAKRFGLQQKNKVRMIDDFSISKVNQTYGLRERLRVQAIDEVCAYLAYLLDSRCRFFSTKTERTHIRFKVSLQTVWHRRVAQQLPQDLCQKSTRRLWFVQSQRITLRSYGKCHQLPSSFECSGLHWSPWLGPCLVCFL